MPAAIVFRNRMGEVVRPDRASGTIIADTPNGTYEIDVADPSPGTGLEYRVYAPHGLQFDGETHVRVTHTTRGMRAALDEALTPCPHGCDCDCWAGDPEAE